MEQNTNTQNSAPSSVTPPPLLCPTCHQPVLPQYYFCPNCGTKLNLVPLNISVIAQIKLYAFSIILPMLGFLLAGKWQGIKYYKSKDEKTKNIGIVACTILILSTIITVWLVIAWTNQAIKSSINSVNLDMSSF